MERTLKAPVAPAPGQRMPVRRPAKVLPRPAGMPAAAREMWTRLYDETPARGLPWGKMKPFPPLVRLVESGWLHPPGPILDIGCGVGSNAFWLAGLGFQVTGVDIAPGAIARAELARPSPGANPKFRVDDVLASNLRTASHRGAVDVGCFQTLPPRTRRTYSARLARLLVAGAPLVLFWVGREESGAWGPPHRLSVTEVTETFEPDFVVDRLEYRPRTVRLTERVRRSARPLATLAGYSARLVRRDSAQPAQR